MNGKDYDRLPDNMPGLCQQCRQNERSFCGGYSVHSTDNLDVLRKIFTDDTDYTMNWLFLSTSGIHGTYSNLNSIESDIEPDDEEEEEDSNNYLTFLVVQPRMVKVIYGGELVITKEDIPWLREVVAKTLEGVIASQQGNLPKKEKVGNDK